MRTLLKIQIPVETGNDTIEDGTLPQVMKGFMDKWKPEAAYFFAMDGVRTALFVFDLKDTSDIPVVAEPFFVDLEADVQFYPVMNAEDLMKGLAKIS